MNKNKTKQQLLTISRYNKYFGRFSANSLNGGFRYNESISQVPWRLFKLRFHCSLHQRLCELVSRLPQVIHGILLCSERLKAIYTDRAEITEESMCERARE